MKRYVLVVSVALFFAAFMWSCQQQDSAPLSPEGSITLGKKPPAATYSIEVFFDKNNGPDPDPGGPDFISVAKLDNATASARGTSVSGKIMTTVNLIDFMDYFLASGSTVLGEPTHCFSAFFDDDGNATTTTFDVDLSVGERDGDPYDAFGYFFTDDKVEPSLTMYMWGVIESEPEFSGVWLLPDVVGDKLVVTGKTKVIPIENQPPGGPDRVGLRIETGKKRTKEACLGGIPNQPWLIVITRTS